MKFKVVLVTNYVPQYRYPIFDEINSSRDYDLSIFTTMPVRHSTKSAQENLDLSFPHGINIILKTKHNSVGVNQKETSSIPFLLPLSLIKSRAQIIISGNMGPTSLVCLFVAKIFRIPFIVWTEEIRESALNISRLQRFFRAIILPRTSAFLTWGKPSYDYMREQGISRDKLYYCAQAVDNDWWIQTSEAHDTKAIKSRLGLTGRAFLLVGQLITRKGFDRILEAWSELHHATQKENHIIIAGQGEEELTLKRIAKDNNIPNVLFTGQRNQFELSELYSVADVFIFPSLVDVWGMVVNEAMCNGLPVLASKYAGASQELITSKEYGELIDPLNTASLTKTLNKWIHIDLPHPKIIRNRIQSVNFDLTVRTFDRLVKRYRDDT